MFHKFDKKRKKHKQNKTKRLLASFIKMLMLLRCFWCVVLFVASAFVITDSHTHQQHSINANAGAFALRRRFFSLSPEQFKHALRRTWLRNIFIYKYTWQTAYNGRIFLFPWIGCVWVHICVCSVCSAHIMIQFRLKTAANVRLSAYRNNPLSNSINVFSNSYNTYQAEAYAPPQMYTLKQWLSGDKCSMFDKSGE